MTFDPVRLAEATVQAGLLFGAVVLPSAWHALDAGLGAVLAGMLTLLAAGVYALHAVTFDCFRLTGQRARRTFSYTRSED